MWWGCEGREDTQWSHLGLELPPPTTQHHILFFSLGFSICIDICISYISYTQCLHSSSSYLQFKAIFLSLFYIFISCIFISAFPLQDEEAGFCSRLLSKSQRAARVRLTLFPNANYFTFLIQRSSLLFIRRLRMSLGSIKCDESGLWQNVADQGFLLILFLESCPLEFKRQDFEIHTYGRGFRPNVPKMMALATTTT